MKQNISNQKIISHLHHKTWANTSSCNQKTNQKDCNLLDNKISYFCTNLKDCIEIAPISSENVEKICEKDFTQVYETSMLTGG